jgi:hypothetical protein
MSGVIYALGGRDGWETVAKRLDTAHGLSPVYWLGGGNKRDAAKSVAPDVVFHDAEDANRARFPSEYDHLSYALDSDDLRQYRRHEPEAIKIMGRRGAGHTFSHEERKRHLRKLLSFYHNLVDELSPQFVVFEQAPHGPAHFALYMVADITNVSTYIFDPTRIPSVTYARRKIHQPSRRLVEIYESIDKSDVTLPDRIEEYFDRVKSDYDAGQPVDYSTRELPHPANKTLTLLYRLATDTVAALRGKDPESPVCRLKRRSEPIEDSTRTPLQRTQYELKSYRHRRRLQDSYADAAKIPNHDRTSVYVPLHYRPERATLPKGREYDDQFLMVKLIRQTIPEDWYIYVKENVYQFIRRDGHKGRSPQLYDDLLELDNVELIETSTDSFELIDNSVAVATVTGTAGWEAVIRGTPALAFGNAWYAPCEGVYRVESRDEVQDAVDDIRTGVTVDEQRVEAFALALQRAGFRGYWGLGEEPPDHDREEMMDNVYRYLLTFLKEDGHISKTTTEIPT